MNPHSIPSHMQVQSTIQVVSSNQSRHNNLLKNRVKGRNVGLNRPLFSSEHSNEAAESSVGSICFWGIHDLEGDHFKSRTTPPKGGAHTIEVKGVEYQSILTFLPLRILVSTVIPLMVLTISFAPLLFCIYVLRSRCCDGFYPFTPLFMDCIHHETGFLAVDHLLCVVIKPILIQLAALFLTALLVRFAINFMNWSFICLL